MPRRGYNAVYCGTEEWINHDQPAISFAGKYLFIRELRSELLLAAIWRQWHPSLFDRSLIILCSDWTLPWGTLLWLVETQPQMSPINQNPRPRHVYWLAHSCQRSPDSGITWNVWPGERGECRGLITDHPLVSNTWVNSQECCPPPGKPFTCSLSGKLYEGLNLKGEYSENRGQVKRRKYINLL